MKTILDRVVRGVTGFVVLAALILGIATSGGSASAAEETAYGPYDDGCYYTWDGYNWTARFCAGENGWTNYYIPVYGAWTFNGWVMLDGTGGLWYQTADALYQYHVSAYGQVTFYDLYGLTTTTTSGTGTTLTPGETAKLQVDQIIFESNSRIIDRILAPACNSSYNGCA